MSLSAWLSSIETALPSMASVLCALICEYTYLKPHTWLATGLHKSIRLRETELSLDGFGPKILRRVVKLFTILVSPQFWWHRVVSSANMGDGDWNWSIAIEDADDELFVGVTTNANNELGIDCSIRFMYCWSIAFTRNTVIFHKYGWIDKRYERTTAFGSSSATVAFRANPMTLEITARSAAIDYGNEIVLMKAESLEELRSVRPCVLLLGNGKVKLISGASEV
jgi:hypothetical protein